MMFGPMMVFPWLFVAAGIFVLCLCLGIAAITWAENSGKKSGKDDE